MKMLCRAVLTAAVLPSLAQAGPIIDFSHIASSPGGNLEQKTFTYQGITIDAFTKNANGDYVQNDNTTIFVRNQGSTELGLGVCGPSEQGATACRPAAGYGTGSTYGGGGGDINELDNRSGNQELLRLTIATGMKWDGAWVSSLDSGGTGGAEAGQMYWSNLADPNNVIGQSSDFLDYAYGSFGGAVTGNVLALADTSFNPSDKYLFFRGNPANGTNNDHLIWGVTTSSEKPPQQITVPEPGTVALWGIGVVALISRRRQQRRT